MIPILDNGCGNGFQTGPSITSNSCQLSVNFLGLVKVYSGGITTTTTCFNPFTGESYENVTTSGCGNNGGSWDWFWE